MYRFREALAKASAELTIGEPARSRVLMEMAGDLEDSFQHFLKRGHDEDEATRLAEESFAVSEQALRHLAKIHETGLDGATERLGEQVGVFWQRALLVVLLAFEVFLAARILVDESFFVFLSPFVWPIAALAIGAFTFAVWKSFQLFGRSTRNPRDYRTGLGALLFIAAASFAVAVTGYLVHLQRFLRTNYEEAPEALFMNFAGFTLGISSLMTIGVLTAIFSSVTWFVLSSLVSRTEQRELESLLDVQDRRAGKG